MLILKLNTQCHVVRGVLDLSLKPHGKFRSFFADRLVWHTRSNYSLCICRVFFQVLAPCWFTRGVTPWGPNTGVLPRKWPEIRHRPYEMGQIQVQIQVSSLKKWPKMGPWPRLGPPKSRPCPSKMSHIVIIGKKYRFKMAWKSSKYKSLPPEMAQN